jgi:pimeloyl-ACP methyl ester carboxylesterase
MVEPLISNQEGLKEQFVDADGIMLHCLEWDPDLLEIQSPSTQKHNNSGGQGDEIPLVMLHGLGATADTWRLCAPHLCRNHRVVAFDQRGHGRSDQPGDGYDLVTIAEDAVHCMASLGLGKVALIGHGWGARVALVLAVRHPALVSHLVLVDCPHVEPKHWPGMTRERFLRQAAPAEMFVSRSAFLNAMRLEMADFWSPEVAAILLTTVRELPGGKIEELLKPERQRLIRQSLWEDRALSYYGKVACPVLLVPAAAQPEPGAHPPEKLENAGEFAAAKGFMAAQVARTIHSCTVLWMPDTVHDIQLHCPQQLAAAIASFIRE